MKITAYDPEYSVWVASGMTTLDAATGSNAGFGPDVEGASGDLSVVALRQVVSLSSNMGDNTLGSVLTTVQSSPWVAQFAVPSNTGAVGSNALLRTQGGGGRVVEVSNSGSAYTLMLGAGNVWDITLTANCSLTLSDAAAAGYETAITVLLRQDGTGGRTVTWPGSVLWGDAGAPTLSTGAAEVDIVDLLSTDAGVTWFGSWGGGAAGTTSPLTTKGDLWSYTTTDARHSVGSNGTALLSDSGEATGLRWSAYAPSGEIMVSDTPAGSPLVFTDLLQNEAQDDLIYGDL